MQKNIKILVLMGSPYLYGSEKANIDVFSALKEKYSHVDIIFLTDISQGDLYIHPYLNNLGLKFIPVHYHYRFLKNMSLVEWGIKLLKITLGCLSLLKIYYKFKPTHFYCSKPEYFLNFFPVLYFINKPIIYRIGDAPVLHNTFYSKLWSYIVKKASIFVCVSGFIENLVRLSGVDENQSIVIYSRPHINQLEKNIIFEHPKKNNTFTVLYIGQIAKHKGVDLLISAAINLCSKYTNLQFLFAGRLDSNDKFTQEILHQVKLSLFSERIKLVDYIDNVDSLYSTSNLHVCPSIYDEPLANVLIDAKKNALPSIIFSVGGLPEIIKHKVNGYICNESTVTSLEKAIEYFFLQQDLCLEMGQNALDSLSELKIEQFSERWLNVFESTR